MIKVEHCAASTVKPNAANTFFVRLNGTEIGLDRDTGGLVWLSPFATGTVIATPAARAGMLDIAFPTDAFVGTRLASRFSRAEVRTNGPEVTIVYDSLGANRTLPLPPGKVSAEIKIRSAPDGRSIVFSAQVRNETLLTIPQIMFPDWNGLVPLFNDVNTQLRLANSVAKPFQATWAPEDAMPFYADLGWEEYAPSGGYYAANALRWIDYGTLKGGISVFQRRWGIDNRPTVRTHRAESDPNRIRLLFEHRPALAPGAIWESGEFWITPHPGGWAKGIEVFRDYVQSVAPIHELPARVRDGVGFMSIWMAQPYDLDPATVAFRYKDLVDVAADAKEHGIDEIVPWNWCDCFRLPISHRPVLGTEEEFVAAIAQAKTIGVNITPFISIQVVRNSLAERYGLRPGTDDWTYDPTLIPNFRTFYTKPDGALAFEDNVLWRKDVLDTLSSWIDRGVSSFVWDVFLSGSPTGKKSELVKLALEIRTLARAKDPDSTFAGEIVSHGGFELDCAVLDYTWNWIDYWMCMAGGIAAYYNHYVHRVAPPQPVDAGPLLSVLAAPRLNCNVERSPLTTLKAFADGLYINVMPRKPDAVNGTSLIRDFPDLSDALKRVAKLRKQFLPYFVRGTYLGDSILCEAVPAFVRARIMDGNKMVIFALNDTMTAQKLLLNIDLTLWLEKADRIRLKTYGKDGEITDQREMSGPTLSCKVPLPEPLDLSILEIEARDESTGASGH